MYQNVFTKDNQIDTEKEQRICMFCVYIKKDVVPEKSIVVEKRQQKFSFWKGANLNVEGITQSQERIQPLV